MNRPSLLPMTWDIPDIFRQRLGDKPGRQRVMFEEEHLLLVVHQVPKPDEVARRGRFFWRKPDGSWLSSDLGSGVTALVKHLQEFETRLQQLDKLEEDAQSAAEYFRVIDESTPITRCVRHLHEVLQEARQLAASDRELLNLRDRAYELDRHAELLMTDARNGLEFAMARRSEQQAEEAHRMSTSAHRLNMLASFFFPMVTLAAVLGTNLRHGFEDHFAPLPFLGMLAVGLFAGIILQAVLRRR